MPYASFNNWGSKKKSHAAAFDPGPVEHFLHRLLDIGLLHRTPQCAVLRYPHPAAPSTFDDVVSPPCWGPAHAASAERQRVSSVGSQRGQRRGSEAGATGARAEPRGRPRARARDHYRQLAPPATLHEDLGGRMRGAG
ncbi:hypothetical protein evm_006455 [Chilo suppressalis]|nr:hypothetical protein evm_006455 [Chilo suppressalis]